MEEIKNRVEISRKLCGCLACCGQQVAGERSTPNGERYKIPLSCLAAQVFVELSKPVLTEGRIAEFAKINADLDHALAMLEANSATRTRIAARQAEDAEKDAILVMAGHIVGTSSKMGTSSKT